LRDSRTTKMHDIVGYVCDVGGQHSDLCDEGICRDEEILAGEPDVVRGGLSIVFSAAS
jgi:hypothetical protein